MKVLIVDDDPDIRRVARLGLTRIGRLEVEEAASGADAVERAEAVRPDAILLDVMMPGMDGPATLEALRARPALAATPVVFLTAKAMPSEVERLKGLGAVGVLTKPFDPMGLAGNLKALLGWP